jgi:hypothetical protein
MSYTLFLLLNLQLYIKESQAEIQKFFYKYYKK